MKDMFPCWFLPLHVILHVSSAYRKYAIGNNARVRYDSLSFVERALSLPCFRVRLIRIATYWRKGFLDSTGHPRQLRSQRL